MSTKMKVGLIVAVVLAVLLVFYVSYAKANPNASKITNVITGQKTFTGKLTTRAIQEVIANPTARSGSGHF